MAACALFSSVTLGDLKRTRAQLRQAEADMAAVLDELGLSRLADIPALSAAGAAAILAETGGPRRYDNSSSLVKHAGMSRPTTPRGPSPGRRTSPGEAGLACGSWSGARYGRCSSTTL